ncbi:MAG: histidine kinase [Bacillota bacterium]
MRLRSATSYANTPGVLLVWAAFYSLKKQLLANQQLQTALLQLRKQSLQLEQMSAIAERNRIAGEIHDTVGHALTSALISIEAGQQLLDSDREAAQEKLALARGQVQQGCRISVTPSGLSRRATRGSGLFCPGCSSCCTRFGRTPASTSARLWN